MLASPMENQFQIGNSLDIELDAFYKSLSFEMQISYPYFKDDRIRLYGCVGI
jgi:hypothetical protein